MHYYTRNLGDYAKKAGRLSMLQHGAYTLLLDACYDRERFPTESEAIEWTWASTPEEEQAVRFVLSRFFEKQEDGTYVQSRVKEELAMFKIGGIQNRLIAISREAKKQKREDLAKACDQLRDEIKHDPLSKTHDAWTSVIDALVKKHEAPPNQEPITNNQEPITTELKTNGADAPALDFKAMFSEFWERWPTGAQFGEKGSRKNAEAAFLKLKPDKTLFTTMIAARDAQARDKQFRVSQGQFASPFQHVERWIKNRRWEDEIGNQVTPGYSSGSVTDQSTVGKAAAAAERKRQEILARNGGGSGTGDGGPVGAYGGAVRGQVVEAIR